MKNKTLREQVAEAMCNAGNANDHPKWSELKEPMDRAFKREFYLMADAAIKAIESQQHEYICTQCGLRKSNGEVAEADF